MLQVVLQHTARISKQELDEALQNAPTRRQKRQLQALLKNYTEIAGVDRRKGLTPTEIKWFMMTGFEE